ncbi:MAG TPA: hypothetical protein VEO53_18480, partial [Candidatus Binatia bacterium]|nr:hypothetical protein [Candidatus Binatia bacterium]
MAWRAFGRWIVSLLLLALSSRHGLPAARGEVAEGLVAEAEEDLPDMNALRARAESGRAAAQTQ